MFTLHKQEMEQRANIQLCFKLGKSFVETYFELMKKSMVKMVCPEYIFLSGMNL